MVCLWKKKVKQNYPQTSRHAPNHHSRFRSPLRLHRQGDLQDVWETGHREIEVKHNPTFSQALSL